MTDADIDRIADAVPVDQIGVHITTWHRRFARAVLAAAPQPKPIAYGMPRADGLILDVITPEEHESYSGEYTVPLYATPPAAPAEPCYCDRMGIGVPGVSCGDCPRDYKPAAPAHDAPLTDEQFADIVAEASLAVDLAANPLKLLAFARAVLSAAPVVPDGMALVPDYRGYAALGTGQYILDISGDAKPAELIIHVATDAEKEGRTVGDLRDKPNPGEVIQPEKMAVRLAFFTVAGLDALEQQLRILRETHFSESAAPAVPLTDEQIIEAASNWDCGMRHENEEWAFKRPRELLQFARAVLALSAAPVVREPLTREQQIALREAHCNTASDEYFGARPHIDSREDRRTYEAGFKEGWESGIGGGGK